MRWGTLLLLGRRAVDAVRREESLVAGRLQQLHDARQQGLQGDEVLSNGLHAVDTDTDTAAVSTHDDSTHDDTRHVTCPAAWR